MRTIIFCSLFMLPFFAFAQNDCVIQKEKDPFDQEIRLSTGFFKIGQVSVSIVADSKEIKFLYSLPGGQCFSDTSGALVYFEGVRTKATYKTASSMNCDGMFSFIYRNVNTTPSALKKLAEQRIELIAFRNSSGKLIEVRPDEEEKQMFMKAASCLVTEAKNLLIK